MIRALRSIAKPGYFMALYRAPTGTWRTANDARGWPIFCESEELALSVADFRRKRYESWS
jgi:hypothetical protein